MDCYIECHQKTTCTQRFDKESFMYLTLIHTAFFKISLDTFGLRNRGGFEARGGSNIG